MRETELEHRLAVQDAELDRLRQQVADASSAARVLCDTLASHIIDLTASHEHVEGCPLRFTTSGECTCALIVSVAELADRLRT